MKMKPIGPRMLIVNMGHPYQRGCKSVTFWKSYGEFGCLWQRSFTQPSTDPQQSLLIQMWIECPKSRIGGDGFLISQSFYFLAKVLILGLSNPIKMGLFDKIMSAILLVWSITLIGNFSPLMINDMENNSHLIQHFVMIMIPRMQRYRVWNARYPSNNCRKRVNKLLLYSFQEVDALEIGLFLWPLLPLLLQEYRTLFL